MGQTLSHGVYLPNEGERNCYAGLASNWQILNTAVGNIAEKAPLVHTHGNISNDGKVGTTANVPLITGTGGVVQAGAFGDQANTFCEGNDSRLSDARTPVAHTHGKSDVTDLLNSNFIPSANNTYDLGSSSYKWKTLNGINPGALSLPDMDSIVSKSTELATAIDKTQTVNSWTADFTGILRITWFVKDLTGPFSCTVSNNSDLRYATWGQTFSVNEAWFFIISFPVQNGKTYYFNNSFTRASEDTAPIIYGANAVYCLGNV